MDSCCKKPDFSTLLADFLLPGLMSAKTACGEGTFLFAPPGVMTEDCAISPHNHGYDLGILVWSGVLADRIYSVVDGRGPPVVAVDGVTEFAYSGSDAPLRRLREVGLFLESTIYHGAGSLGASYAMPADAIHAPFVASADGAVWLRVEKNRIHDDKRRLYAAQAVVPAQARLPTASEKVWAVDAYIRGVKLAADRERRK